MRTPWLVAALTVFSVLVVGLFILGQLTRGPVISVAEARRDGRIGCRQARVAFTQRRDKVWLTVAADVYRVLPDSGPNAGPSHSTHQRFIIRCPSGQTVLVDDNVDVGERVPVTDHERVVVHGQYIWNALGGLVHDTHHSTGVNPDGWILAGDRTYS